MNTEKLTRTLAKFLGTTEAELLDGFRPATTSEVNACSELRAPELNDSQRSQDLDYLNWRFFERTKGVSDLWVCKPKQDLLAIVGLERMSFIKGKEEYDFVRIIDLYVAPELQKFGIAAWMCLRIKDLFPRVMVIGSNENSLSVTQKLWPSINILQKFKRPLGVDGIFTGSRVFGYLTRLQLVKGAALTINRFLMQRKLGGLASSADLKVYERPAELGHALEAQGHVSDSHPNRMQTTRNQSFINWRFDQHPGLTFRATSLVDKQGQLLAYLVATAPIQSVDGEAVCLQRSYLVDWRIFDDNAASLAQLVLDYCLHASNQGVFMVEAQTTDVTSRNAMQRAGFWARERDARFFVHDRDQDWSTTSNDEWAITWADTDQIDLLEDIEISQPLSPRR